MTRCSTVLLLVLAATLGHAQSQQNPITRDSQDAPIKVAYEDPTKSLLSLIDTDTSSSSNPQAATPVAAATPPKDNGFFHRLGRAYYADWSRIGPWHRGSAIGSPRHPAADLFATLSRGRLADRRNGRHRRSGYADLSVATGDRREQESKQNLRMD